MRRTILPLSILLLACLLSCGCGNADRDMLVGIWAMEKPDSLMGRLNQQTETEQQRAESGAETSPISDDSTPKMQIQFRRNGTLSTITQMGRISPRPKSGTWELISFDRSSGRMQIKCTINAQESEHEVEFVDSNTIRLVPPNMAGLRLKIKFKRQR